jgi:hypothetical protein
VETTRSRRRAKRSPASGEEHGPRVALALQVGEEGRQIVVERVVDGVHRTRRMRDRHAQHVAFARSLEGRVVRS